MKTRALAIAAMCGAMGFAAVAMDAPTRVVVAEEAKKESAYKTAQEVLASFKALQGTSFKNPRNPSKDEIKAYYTETFVRAHGYLNAYPDAKDHNEIYDYAMSSRANGYGISAFVKIAEMYLQANPTADNVMLWKEASICASLGDAELKAAGEKALADLEKSGQTNVQSRFTALMIKHSVATATGDSEAQNAIADIIAKDKEILGSTDVKINRRLMRILLPKHKANVAQGQAFPDWSSVMTVCDLDGKPISVADYKGKVVLIDFWATWCGPCIGEMPNVVKLYNAHNKDGFEVIGLSFDNDTGEQKLRDTIAGKGPVGTRTGVMPWRQVYDGGGWGSGMAGRYGVRGIPHTVLIDREGKVAAIGLRGPELDAKVKELLGGSGAAPGGKSGEAKPADDGSKKF